MEGRESGLAFNERTLSGEDGICPECLQEDGPKRKGLILFRTLSDTNCAVTAKWKRGGIPSQPVMSQPAIGGYLCNMHGRRHMAIWRSFLSLRLLYRHACIPLRILQRIRETTKEDVQTHLVSSGREVVRGERFRIWPSLRDQRRPVRR